VDVPSRLGAADRERLALRVEGAHARIPTVREVVERRVRLDPTRRALGEVGVPEIDGGV
jgi:hypothetical protein